MKRSRFSEEQIISILKEQEAGLGTADLYRKHGISSATLYKWNAEFGGPEASDARRLKALEDENARLKRLLAEATLDNAILKDVASKIVTPDAKRDAVVHACLVRGVSQRQAGEALEIDRSGVKYLSRHPDNLELRDAMKNVASQRRRFG